MPSSPSSTNKPPNAPDKNKPTNDWRKIPVPRGRIWLWFLGILALNYFFSRTFFPDPAAPVKIPYTLFKDEVAQEHVSKIYSKGETISGQFTNTIKYSPPAESLKPEQPPLDVKNFTTILPAFVDPGLEAFLIEHKVEISAEPIQEEANPFLSFLLYFGPGLLIIGFYIWLFRRARNQGGLGGMGAG